LATQKTYIKNNKNFMLLKKQTFKATYLHTVLNVINNKKENIKATKQKKNTNVKI